MEDPRLSRRAVVGESLSDPWFCETLFDQTPGIVFFVKDADARYIVVNQTLVCRCGVRSKRELLGKTALDIFPRQLGEFFIAQDREVLRTGAEIANRLELHLYAGGKSGWCLTDKMPLHDGRGNVIGLAGISRDLHNPGEERTELTQLSRAVSHIRDHLHGPLRIGQIAKGVGLTITRFERLVVKVYGLKPSQLLAKMRIEAASQLLLGSDRRITEIAYECGYADHSAFTRQFRSVVGMTPSEFREKVRTSGEDAGIVSIRRWLSPRRRL